MHATDAFTTHLDGIVDTDAILAILALAETDDAAPSAVISTATFAHHAPHTELPADTVTAALDWIRAQRAAQPRAQALARILHDRHPIPADPTAGLPGWFGTWWGMSLHQPWSGRLTDAITECVTWLAMQGTPAWSHAGIEM